MRYSCTLTRPDGKTVLLAADEWIDIDIKAGMRYIARLTVRDGKVYDDNDYDISTAQPPKDCNYTSDDSNYCITHEMEH